MLPAIAIAGLLLAPALADEPKSALDLAYAGTKGKSQSLDAYYPSKGTGHPILVWIHGGGWQGGDKSQVHAKPKAFVARGFVFVSVNYRLLPHGTIKQMGQDVAKAIRWTRDHAKRFGGDAGTIFVAGHSAGAQLAALVCTDEKYLKAEKMSLADIKGCVPVDGDTYDVPMQIKTVSARIAAIYRKKFGDEASQKALSPVTHAARGKGIPPFLILHVAGHPETKGQSQRLAKALKEAGVQATAWPAADRNHSTLDSRLGEPGDKPTAALLDFLTQARKKKAGGGR